MSDKYDVAIIGSGIGGLLAGIDLQKSGIKTIILEKHSQPGGYCTSFKRQKYLFDVGIHMLTGVGNKQTVIGAYLSKLNLKLNLFRYEYLDKIFFPDKTYILPGDPLALLEYLSEKFPAESKSLELFFDNLKQILVFYNDGLAGKLQRITFENYLLDFFKDQQLLNIFRSQTFYLGLIPKQIAAISMMFLLGSMLYHGRYYPEGGTGAFSSALAATYLEAGGKLIFNSSVIKFNIEQESIKQLIYVQNNLQQELQANYFVSNADARLTILKMAGKEYFNKSYIQKIKKYKTSYAGYAAYFGLKKPKHDIYKASGLHFNLIKLNSDKLYPYYIHTPKLFDPKLSPPDTQIVIFNAKTNLENPNKKQVLNYFLNLFDNSFPNMHNSIEVIETATPATFEKYTGNSNGAFYGWAATPKQALNNSLPNKTPLKNLFLAGHWSYPQAGILGVAMSGLHTSKKIKAIL